MIKAKWRVYLDKNAEIIHERTKSTITKIELGNPFYDDSGTGKYNLNYLEEKGSVFITCIPGYGINRLLGKFEINDKDWVPSLPT